MDNIVTITSLTFSYSSSYIFKDFDLSIKRGSFTSIVGSNGSGKSTLLRILVGLYPFKGTINIDNMDLNDKNKEQIRKKIGMVFENPDLNFVTETVEDEIVFPMENLKFNKEQIEEQLDEILELFHLNELRKYSIHQLSGGEKQLVALASAYALKPNILILDEALAMIDGTTKEIILKILKKLNHDKKVTVIMVTHDLEDSLKSDTIIVLNNGQILKEGLKQEILNDEKLLKKAHLEQPFMASLSNKLAYYDLVKTPIYDMNRMVNTLWK